MRLSAIEYARDSGGTIDNFGTINDGTAGPARIVLRHRALARPAPSRSTIMPADRSGRVGGSRLRHLRPGGRSCHRQRRDDPGRSQRHRRVTSAVSRSPIAASSPATAGPRSGSEAATICSCSTPAPRSIGDVTASGPDNRLRLQGTGFEDSDMTGLANLTMAGSAWTLSGAIALTRREQQYGRRAGRNADRGGHADDRDGGGATIASGAGLTLGAGGFFGSITGNIVDNGVLTLNRSDAGDVHQCRQRYRIGGQAGPGHDDAVRGEQLCRRHPPRGRHAQRLEQLSISAVSGGPDVRRRHASDDPVDHQRAGDCGRGRAAGPSMWQGSSTTLTGPISGAGALRQERRGRAGPDRRQHRLHREPDDRSRGSCCSEPVATPAPSRAT